MPTRPGCGTCPATPTSRRRRPRSTSRFPRRAARPRLAGVRGHRLALGTLDCRHPDRPRSDLSARTWCDLARVLDDEDLLAAGDRILWRRDPSGDRARPSLPRSRRIPRVRVARGSVASIPMLERSLRLPPRVRHPTRDSSRASSRVRRSTRGACITERRLLAQVDLAFVEFRMALEYEGDHHRTDRDQWRSRPANECPRLEDERWHTYADGPRDLADSRELIARLARRLRERGWRPPTAQRLPTSAAS